jgi:hypothetical protein
MNDIFLNLLVLVSLTLLAGLVFFIVRRSQKAGEKKILELAAEKGWKYESVREPLLWGFRLVATHWALESISRSSGQATSPGSSNITMQTVWHANAPGNTLLIGERTSQVDLGELGERLTRQVLQLALGGDADGLVEVRAGSEAFRRQYMLWARDPEGFRVSPALESALLNWKGVKPLIKRTSKGLTIEVRGVRLKTADRILDLVQLAEILL